MFKTGYHALDTPYAFIGLGRTNNYVEVGPFPCMSRLGSSQRLSIGASLYPPNHLTELDSIVPNSQVIINPPSPDTFSNDSSPVQPQDSPVKARSTSWRSELYLKPGDWVPWVGAAVAGTVIVLGGVVLALSEREKVGDVGRVALTCREKMSGRDSEHCTRSISRPYEHHLHKRSEGR